MRGERKRERGEGERGREEKERGERIYICYSLIK
jgi:hypothetical protein